MAISIHTTRNSSKTLVVAAVSAITSIFEVFLRTFLRALVEEIHQEKLQ
jgi:hypothetical protein